MNPKSQGVAASFRHSHESGNPGLPGPQRLLWTPAFAGVTITFRKDGIHFGSGSLEVAGSVDADRRRAGADLIDGFDAAQHRGGHVAPAGDEGGKPAGLAADHEEVDVVGARHDRNPRPRLALVPFRQVAIVDLSVALIEGEV